MNLCSLWLKNEFDGKTGAEARVVPAFANDPDHDWTGRWRAARQLAQMTDTHVVSALKAKRVQLASQIEDYREKMRQP